VISLLMPVVLSLTVVLSVGIGVLTAYATVFGILNAFAGPRQPKKARPRLVLVPTQHHASGD